MLDRGPLIVNEPSTEALTPTELRLEADIVDPTQAPALAWWLSATEDLDLQPAFLEAITCHLRRGVPLAGALELAGDAVERTSAWRDAAPGD